MESRIVSGGHSIASIVMGAQLTPAGYVDEQMGGLSYLFYLRELVKRVDSDWPSVQADLEQIRSAILSRKGCLFNFTADEAALSRAMTGADRLLSALPATAATPRAAWSAVAPKKNQLITVPTQVNYVGKSADLYKAGYKLGGSAYVINKLIGTRHASPKHTNHQNPVFLLFHHRLRPS